MLPPDLSSYEAACQADPQLRSLDATLKECTSRAINSIAVGLDFRALSLLLKGHQFYFGAGFLLCGVS